MPFKYALAFAAALSLSAAHAQDWRPARNVDIIVSSGAAEARKHLDAEFLLLQKVLADLGVSGKPESAK